MPSLFRTSEWLKERSYVRIIRELDDDVLTEQPYEEKLLLYLYRAISYYYTEYYQDCADDCSFIIANIGIYRTGADMSNYEIESSLDVLYSAYMYKGKANLGLKVFNFALTDFNEALNIKENSAETLTEIANCYYMGGEKDSALRTIEQVLTHHSDYIDAYICKGNILMSQKKYTAAQTIYNAAFEIEPSNSNLNYHIGLFNLKLRNTDIAKNYFNKAVELGNDNFQAIFEKCNLTADRLSKKKKITDDERYLFLTDYAGALRTSKAIEWTNYWEKFDKVCKADEPESTPEPFFSELKELKDRIVSFQSKNDIIGGLISLADIKDKILAYAYYIPEQEVAHYTKLRVADLLINPENEHRVSEEKEIAERYTCSSMRFYNVVYMNDPSEGWTMFDSFENNSIRNWFETFEKEEGLKSNVYLGSFLSNENHAHEDDLVMWRTYGKDEDNREAAGCCILFNPNFFKSKYSVHGNVKRKKEITQKKQQALYKVIYYNKHSRQFHIGTQTEKFYIEQCLKELNKVLSELLDNYIKDIQDADNGLVYSLIYRIVSELRFLFKSSDFSYENECRVIIFATAADSKVFVDKKGWPKRMYYDTQIEVRDSISKIVLGPLVKNKNHWLFLEGCMNKYNRELQMNVVGSGVVFQ